MFRSTKRMTASVLAAALSVSAVPYIEYCDTAVAAETLMTRDVWCANEDVNRWESEHFQFIWGKHGADSAKITQSFLEENAKNLEACWDVYMNDLSMEPPTQSVNMQLRDGNKYKVNFYISGTGLSPFADDWAYMGYDSQGYAFMFCCVGAMQNSPNPSWVLPHEFGHVVTAHQLGWNENKYVQSWWEAIANWYREQFLYSDYYSQWKNVNGITDYFETYMKNLCFTPILGRDNYASWAFLQYITENPDGLPGYGSSFVKELMQKGQRDEYPYAEIERLSGADIKETLGNYAKRLATLDMAHKKEYQARQQELLARGAWNWGEIFTILENTSGRENYYTVPTERAPQQFGVNIVPLEAEGGKISVTLEGLTNVNGADWRACIAVEQKDGTTRYSDLFKPGETMTMNFVDSDSEAYLTVTATPDKSAWQQVGVPWAYGKGEFDESHFPFLSKARYPWAATITGAKIKQEQDAPSTARGAKHPNGGGFVASTAKVDSSVYVGPDAKVLGYATVNGNAVVDDHAVVTGNARVSGNAIITGHAVVAESAVVKDNAIIADYAGVMGQAVVSENARVLESGLVFNTYKVYGDATIKGVAYCLSNGSATGQAMPDGDYYDDSGRTVQKGSIYGWTSYDEYALNRPYTDGQMAALEFSADSSYMAGDIYTSTFGITMGAPTWSESKTSGKGVLTFDGSANQYIIADSSYAALHNAEYQTAVLLRDNSRNEIFRFGSDKYISLTAENGSVILTGADQSVSVDDAYVPGEWITVSVLISEGKALLKVSNGKKLSSSEGAFAAEPVDFMGSDAVYLIGDGMNGSMDYFRVYNKDAADPEYYYTESEDISSVIGDVNADGRFNIADIVLVQNWLLARPDTILVDWKAGDLCPDNKLDGFDLCLMREMLLEKQ
ncbi:MAG TPA: DUF6055 domain-containing protein [Ruminococcus sp.]|nr:DUF6055 domain-containing protein [Ruminococcus sp.]